MTGTSARMARVVYSTMALMAILCFETSCVTRIPKQEMIRGALEPGFLPYPTPRVFDGPGYLYREAPGRMKRYFPVTQLSVDVVVAGDEAFGKKTGSGRWSGELLGSWFPSALGDLRLNANKDYLVQIELIGAERHRVYDEELERALRESKVKWKNAHRYYVVREAIAVRGLRVLVQEIGDSSVEVRGGVRGVTPSGGLSMAITNASSFRLDRDFEQPHFVYYTREEVVAASGFVVAFNAPRSKIRSVPSSSDGIIAK